MEGLIGLLFWIAIITKIVKAVKGDKKKPSRPMTQVRQQAQQRPVQRTAQTQRTTQAQRDAYYYNQQNATKQRLQQKYATQPKATPKSDILSRAKENVQEVEMDTMQQEVHAEVCRDYRENAYVTPDVDAHKVMSTECDTGEESDIIKRVNDLIVTGYSGDMNFDRDFIAEGVDMLNRFTV